MVFCVVPKLAVRARITPHTQQRCPLAAVHCPIGHMQVTSIGSTIHHIRSDKEPPASVILHVTFGPERQQAPVVSKICMPSRENLNALLSFQVRYRLICSFTAIRSCQALERSSKHISLSWHLDRCYQCLPFDDPPMTVDHIHQASGIIGHAIGHRLASGVLAHLKIAFTASLLRSVSQMER
ncbi:hypothetical protein K437DRAFT_169684 [Tilletiaria anomala UBC 951]|uniref:Uncharacterized protein n=1 Tax=Tilletiaria anomala (strain ATCC 24038 / CBS 436.72 / UBC 951) TaxID=1037660 RepID=A0A066VKB4_TILAU|nr:uncharacterized protein K437DRAFT_169684 [Tilletiaria anomala UBC 951]KDN41881.1 hypothetical protein K437DRAFT_169684 [Tilletiaria anomala UBC 951]